MCSPGGAGHGIGGITGDLDSLGDVADSQDPIQRLGFKYFHVLGSPLFELFIAWAPPRGPLQSCPSVWGTLFRCRNWSGPSARAPRWFAHAPKEKREGGSFNKGFLAPLLTSLVWGFYAKREGEAMRLVGVWIESLSPNSREGKFLRLCCL